MPRLVGKIPLERRLVILFNLPRSGSGWYWKMNGLRNCTFIVSGRFFGQYKRWRVENITTACVYDGDERRLIASLREALSAQLEGAGISGLSLDKIEWEEKR